MQTKLLDFVSLPGETSELIFTSLLETLEKDNLASKLVGFCADNANTNFGGLKRKGTNNIFAKLEKKFKRKIIGVGCAAHIIHNAIQTACDLLPVNIENMIVNLYKHF